MKIKILVKACSFCFFVFAMNGATANLTVTNLRDDGAGSLRRAIVAASAGDSISLAVTGVITLATGTLLVDKELAINGPGADVLSISGNNVARVFYVSGALSISGVTIRDGWVGNAKDPWGGGFLIDGILTLTNCVVTNNSVIGIDGVDGTAFFPPGPGGHGLGGGIQNDGTLTLTRCTVSGNSAIGGSGGSAFDGGTNGGSGYGGGIGNEGKLTLIECILEGNTARGGSGGGGHDGGGAAGIGEGGAIINAGDLTFIQCSLHNNTAGGGSGGSGFLGGGAGGAAQGAGVANLGALTVVGCTLYNNSALGGEGGFGYGGGAGGGDALGGGIANFRTLILSQCTISANSTEPGLGGDSHSSLRGPSGRDEGGGLFALEGAMITNCTIVCNRASNAGGVSSTVSSTTIRNTIVARNGSGDSKAPDCGGTFTSQGYNLVGNTNGCLIDGNITPDLYGQDPLIGPLQDNGGLTWTHALLAGSSAIDAGNSDGLALDQRGHPRGIDFPAIPNATGGDGSDIGAFEVDNLIIALERSGGNVRVKFISASNYSYRVEYALELPSTNWTALPGTFQGTGSILCATNFDAANQPRRFYRARQQ